MSTLEPLAFSPKRCLQEARELQDFLGARDTLRERDQVLPFFKERKQLSAFVGSYHGQVIQHDRVAHEYPLFGDFACDLVAGDWHRRAYVFVELEDAAPASIFRKIARATPEWSPRFEHGFSQILDWFYKLDTQRHTPDFESRFGGRIVNVSGLLVIGREQHLDAREQDRLQWRQEHVQVNGKHVYCVTFDQLCEDLLLRLETYRSRR